MNARNLVRKPGLLVGLSLLVLVLLPRSAAATAGGQSVYVPGAYGNFGMGMIPGPGVYFNDFGYWPRGIRNQNRSAAWLAALRRFGAACAVVGGRCSRTDGRDQLVRNKALAR